MKKIILSLVTVFIALSVNATDNTVTSNAIEVYKNGTLVKTYVDNAAYSFRAELNKATVDGSVVNQILIYKYTSSDNAGSVVATYINSSTGNYRADLKQIEETITGTATTEGGQTVKWVQLWAGGPKFAAVNVGATINDYTGITTYDKANIGGYYSWGASEDQTEDNYTTVSQALADIQGTNHDTAKQIWGNNWMMPTKAQFDDLLNTSNTTWTWCTGESGSQFEDGCTLAGYKITGSTGTFKDNSIFLPATGLKAEGEIYYEPGASSLSNYWASTNYKLTNDANGAYIMYFTSGYYAIDGDYRTYGCSVRAILDEKSASPTIWVKDIALDVASSFSIAVDETTKINATVTPSNATQALKWESSNTNIATVDENGNVTGVASGSATIKVTATDGSKVVVYTIANVKASDANLLSGKFSVSATKQVQFTKGNLYWDGSAYQFEANQTDYPTTWSASHVGHFFWTKTASASYAASYDDGTNTTADQFWCDGSDTDHKLTVSGTSDLYALSSAEWTYLISGRTNASSLYKNGVTVGSVANCFIIAPDNYDYGTTPLADSYTLEQANNLGIVCFPAAGYRDGGDFTIEGTEGYYWTSTATTGSGNALNAAKYFDFMNSGWVDASDDLYRSTGSSLRLVKTVE